MLISVLQNAEYGPMFTGLFPSSRRLSCAQMFTHQHYRRRRYTCRSATAAHIICLRCCTCPHMPNMFISNSMRPSSHLIPTHKGNTPAPPPSPPSPLYRVGSSLSAEFRLFEVHDQPANDMRNSMLWNRCRLPAHLVCLFKTSALLSA